MQEGLKSGNVSETCRRFGIAQTLYSAGKTERNREPRPRLGENAAVAESKKDRRIRQLERTLGRESLEIEILKNVAGE